MKSRGNGTTLPMINGSSIYYRERRRLEEGSVIGKTERELMKRHKQGWLFLHKHDFIE